MRVFYKGPLSEAQQWLGTAQQEMYRLELRMKALGVENDQFYLQLSQDASCSGKIFGDYKEIRIDVEAEQTVEVSEDAGYFEFATSAWPIVRWSGTQEGIAFDSYKGCVVGVTLSARDGVLDTLPEILGRKRTRNGADVSLIGRAYQADLISEPALYPFPLTEDVTHYPEALYESWAPGSPHTGVMLRGTSFTNAVQRFNSGPLTQYTVRDKGYDVPFAHGVGRGQVESAYLQAPADWPRASAMQTVTSDNYGSRRYAIAVDAFDQFSVFPLDAIGSLDPDDFLVQNVNPTLVKRVKPAFPSWCYVNTQKVRTRYSDDPLAFDAHSIVDFPELDWKFNPAGTKAATIVYARSPFVNDAAYWDSAIGTEIDDVTPWHNAFTQAKFDAIAARCGVQSRRDGTIPEDDHAPDRFFVAPGIIEVSLTITINGPGAGDFEPTLTLRVVRDPRTASLCPLLVGYVWADVASAHVGDFVSLDVEAWAPKTGNLLDTFDAGFLVTPAANRVRLLSLKNLNTGAEIDSYLADALIAADLSTLSFVVLHLPHHVGVLAGRLALGASVYFGSKLKETLYSPLATEAQKAAMHAEALFSARARINAYIAIDPRWQLIPLNSASDGWGSLRMQRFREHWARVTAAAKRSPDPLETGTADWQADIDSGYEDLHMRWTTFPNFPTGQGSHAMYSDNPRWGWHVYQDVIAGMFWSVPETTFYTHPNGTWCLWSNAYINRGESAVGQGTAGSYQAFDVSKMEHVIFDRVHLELATDKKVATVDTTFFDLYNRAVLAGKDSIDPLENIKALAAANVRASFDKQLVTTFADGSSVDFLEIVALWDERTWFLPDSDMVRDWSPHDSYHATAPARPQGGTTFGATFSQQWWNGPGYSLGVSAPTYAPHVRFANPLLIGA